MGKTSAVMIGLSTIAIGLGVPAACLYATVFYGFNSFTAAVVAIAGILIGGAVISVSVIVLSYPCGKIIDKIGNKIPLLVSFLLVLLAMPFLIWGDFTKLLLLTPVIALVNILIGTASQALTADLIPPEHRGKISGSRSFFVLISASIGRSWADHLRERLPSTSPVHNVGIHGTRSDNDPAVHP